MGIPTTTLLLIGGVGLLVFVVVLLSLMGKLFIKAEAGDALVKTGFGMSEPQVALSSAFVLPLLHRIDTLDLTVKTVRIARREHESLSCADGIRAEVEVDFYIKINAVEQDIQHVAATIGCDRASDIGILRQLFEAKFADALKTAGAKLEFDQLYQNRLAFRDEILKALGQEGNQAVVLNGYKLDDVAIQYLEQLPLEMHNEDNVLDARGRKEIAERTSHEAEAANKRLRQKEVTIAEQDREARVRQLVIAQDIREKEALQGREIREAEATEKAQTEKTVAEQEQIAEEARIAKERRIRVAEEEREKEIETAEIRRHRSVELAEEERSEEIESAQIRRERAVALAKESKLEELEIARIRREAAEAEAQKAKLLKLEETAKQEAEYVHADEQKETVRAVEQANRKRKIEVIEAEMEAAVEREERQVAADVRAYETRTIAQAELEAAELDAEAAEKKALATETVGLAEATVRQATLDAENTISQRVILGNTLRDLTPQLPDLVEHMMRPVDKIEDIRILHVNGLNGSGTNGISPARASAPEDTHSIAGDVVSTVLNVGVMMPVIREIMKGLRTDTPKPAIFSLPSATSRAVTPFCMPSVRTIRTLPPRKQPRRDRGAPRCHAQTARNDVLQTAQRMIGPNPEPGPCSPSRPPGPPAPGVRRGPAPAGLKRLPPRRTGSGLFRPGRHRSSVVDPVLGADPPRHQIGRGDVEGRVPDVQRPGSVVDGPPVSFFGARLFAGRDFVCGAGSVEGHVFAGRRESGTARSRLVDDGPRGADGVSPDQNDVDVSFRKECRHGGVGANGHLLQVFSQRLGHVDAFACRSRLGNHHLRRRGRPQQRFENGSGAGERQHALPRHPVGRLFGRTPVGVERPSDARVRSSLDRSRFQFRRACVHHPMDPVVNGRHRRTGGQQTVGDVDEAAPGLLLADVLGNGKRPRSVSQHLQGGG